MLGWKYSSQQSTYWDFEHNCQLYVCWYFDLVIHARSWIYALPQHNIELINTNLLIIFALKNVVVDTPQGVQYHGKRMDSKSVSIFFVTCFNKIDSCILNRFGQNTLYFQNIYFKSTQFSHLWNVYRPTQIGLQSFSFGSIFIMLFPNFILWRQNWACKCIPFDEFWQLKCKLDMSGQYNTSDLLHGGQASKP